MLASMDHCTTRSVFKTLVIEEASSREFRKDDITSYVGIRLCNTHFLSRSLTESDGSHYPGPHSKAAAARRSETTPDAPRTPRRAPPASNKKSHPRPAPDATSAGAPRRAPRQTYRRQCGTQDASPPAETVHPCRLVPAA